MLKETTWWNIEVKAGIRRKKEAYEVFEQKKNILYRQRKLLRKLAKKPKALILNTKKKIQKNKNTWRTLCKHNQEYFITRDEPLMNRWKEHFEELLNANKNSS